MEERNKKTLQEIVHYFIISMGSTHINEFLEDLYNKKLKSRVFVGSLFECDEK